MSSLAVAPPSRQELEAVFAVLGSYHLHLLGDASLADPDFPADALLRLRNGIITVDLEREALVARREERVLGVSCWTWLDEAAAAAKTVLIAVTPEARGLGVGAALQAARMRAMWDAGAETIHTWSDDPAAIAWYERHFGYERAGEEPIRHALHRFRWGRESWWGIHRGFPERTTLTHLVARQPATQRQP